MLFFFLNEIPHYLCSSVLEKESPIHSVFEARHMGFSLPSPSSSPLRPHCLSICFNQFLMILPQHSYVCLFPMAWPCVDGQFPRDCRNCLKLISPLPFLSLSNPFSSGNQNILPPNIRLWHLFKSPCWLFFFEANPDSGAWSTMFSHLTISPALSLIMSICFSLWHEQLDRVHQKHHLIYF